MRIDLLSKNTRDEIISECKKDNLNIDGMIDRVIGTYSANISCMNSQDCIAFVAEVYNFSETTIENIINTFLKNK
jgi:hypothetical protein